ncbi:MAG: hypothetical protein ACYCU7_11475 [Acidimicrobiales bacterium]
MTSPADPSGALRRPDRGRHRSVPWRRAVAALSCVAAAGLVAGCGVNAAAPASQRPGAVLTKTTTSSTQPRTTTTTTTTTTAPTSLPECGAARDPFDPTGASPPAGSAAIC